MTAYDLARFSQEGNPSVSTDLVLTSLHLFTSVTGLRCEMKTLHTRMYIYIYTPVGTLKYHKSYPNTLRLAHRGATCLMIFMIQNDRLSINSTVVRMNLTSQLKTSMSILSFKPFAIPERSLNLKRDMSETGMKAHIRSYRSNKEMQDGARLPIFSNLPAAGRKSAKQALPLGRSNPPSHTISRISPYAHMPIIAHHLSYYVQLIYL